MKKVMSIALVAMLIAGTTAVYAGTCGGCSDKKGEKKDKASTEKTEQASTNQEANASA